MFDNIFAAIEKWMRELLSGMVESNLSTMFTAVNQQTSEIAAQVGQTPQGWNSSIFSMIRNISDSVVIPIAGIIITLILCYELISMLTERQERGSTKKSVLDALRSLKAKKQEQPAQEQPKPQKGKKRGDIEL